MAKPWGRPSVKAGEIFLWTRSRPELEWAVISARSETAFSTIRRVGSVAGRCMKAVAVARYLSFGSQAIRLGTSLTRLFPPDVRCCCLS